MAENPNENPIESVALTVVEEKNNDQKEVQSGNLKPPKKKRPFKSIKMKQVVLPVVLITFLLSIPFIFEAVWLLYVQQYDCERLLKSLPRLQIGIAIGLICVFFISNAVVFSRSKGRFVALGLIIVKFLLVLMFIVGLTLTGSFSMETRQIPGSPRWLKMMVRHDDKWDSIKSCLYDARMCRDLLSRSYNLQTYEYAASNLSPIEVIRQDVTD